jgi:hypothetical protein
VEAICPLCGGQVRYESAAQAASAEVVDVLVPDRYFEAA